MGRSQVRVRVDVFDPVERELGVHVTVALGMPANERMDLLVEKATELGVAAVQPLLCARSVLRLAGDRAQRKRAHWQGIAAAAAEQCGRTRVPEVAAVQTLDAFLAQPPAPGLRLLLSLGEGVAALHQVAAGAHALLTLSGPEGGLSADEEDAALARGFVRARLGDRAESELTRCHGQPRSALQARKARCWPVMRVMAAATTRALTAVATRSSMSVKPRRARSGRLTAPPPGWAW